MLKLFSCAFLSREKTALIITDPRSISIGFINCGFTFSGKKKADAQASAFLLSLSAYKLLTAFSSSKACSRRVTMPTSPARCQTRGS